MKHEANGKVETIANFDDVNLNGAVELAKNAVHVDHASCVQFIFCSSINAEASDCMSFTVNDKPCKRMLQRRKSINARDALDSLLANPKFMEMHQFVEMHRMKTANHIAFFEIGAVIIVALFILSIFCLFNMISSLVSIFIMALFVIIVLSCKVFADEKNSSCRSENITTVRAIT